MIYLALIATYIVATLSQNQLFPLEENCGDDGSCPDGKICEIPAFVGVCTEPCVDTAGCEARYEPTPVPAEIAFVCLDTNGGCTAAMCTSDSQCEDPEEKYCINLPLNGDVCSECGPDAITQPCVDTTLVCDTTRYNCVQCMENNDCVIRNDPDRTVCDIEGDIDEDTEQRCVGCLTDADCDAGDQCLEDMYNYNNRVCTECTMDSDCTDEDNLYCAPDLMCDYNCEHINGTCFGTCDLSISGTCFDEYCTSDANCSMYNGDYGLPYVCDRTWVANSHEVGCQEQDCVNTQGYCLSVAQQWGGADVLCDVEDNRRCRDITCNGITDGECASYNIPGFDICGPTGFCIEDCTNKNTTYCSEILESPTYACSNGDCVQTVCTVDDNCEQGYYCDGALCQMNCTGNEQICPGGLAPTFCQAGGICAPNSCSSNSNCPTNYACDVTNQQCILSCNYGVSALGDVFCPYLAYEDSPSTAHFGVCNTATGLCEYTPPQCTHDANCSVAMNGDDSFRCNTDDGTCYYSFQCDDRGGDIHCFCRYGDCDDDGDGIGGWIGATCDDTTGNCNDVTDCRTAGCGFAVDWINAHEPQKSPGPFQIPCSKINGQCFPELTPAMCFSSTDCYTGYICSLIKNPEAGLPWQGFCIEPCTDNADCNGLLMLICDDDNNDGVCDDETVLKCITADGDDKGQCDFVGQCSDDAAAPGDVTCDDFEECQVAPFLPNFCTVDCSAGATDAEKDAICASKYAGRYSNAADIKCRSETMFSITVNLCDKSGVTLLTHPPTTSPITVVVTGEVSGEVTDPAGANTLSIFGAISVVTFIYSTIM